MSRRLPAVKPRQVIAALQRAGFRGATGQRQPLSANPPDDPIRRVVVAHHNRDLKPKDSAPIIKQAGLTVDEFIDLL